MNRILFVYGELLNGGIQTLIVRLANYLANQSRPVAVCVPGGELVGHLAQGVDRLTWTSRRDAVRKALAWVGESPEAVTLVSFDPISAAIALSIETSADGKTPAVHLSGVYHPRSFFMTGERRDRIFLNRLIAKAVGDTQIFYMNVECRSAHERQWRLSLESSRIIPLPIELRSARWRMKAREKLKIVSVGRLVDFKSYNLASAEIAVECRMQGVDLCWDIFGAGPLEAEMRMAIRQHRAGGLVELKGQLPYERFEDAVAEYDLFVGMGTAALQAAMIGVPTIVTTESELRRSYGFVSDLPLGNVGERQSFAPPNDVGDQIRNYASMSPAHRRRVGERCRNAVLDYSEERCVEELDKLASDSTSPPSIGFKKAVSALYEGLTASPLADFARRLRAVGRR